MCVLAHAAEVHGPQGERVQRAWPEAASPPPHLTPPHCAVCDAAAFSQPCQGRSLLHSSACECTWTLRLSARRRLSLMRCCSRDSSSKLAPMMVMGSVSTIRLRWMQRWVGCEVKVGEVGGWVDGEMDGEMDG